MNDALIVFAALGVVLLWERAKPIQPIRDWVVIRANRMWQRVVTKGVPALAWPFAWLKGVAGCGECLSPYAGFFLSLCWQENVARALLHGLATYAVYVALFARKDAHERP